MGFSLQSDTVKLCKVNPQEYLTVTGKGETLFPLWCGASCNQLVTIWLVGNCGSHRGALLRSPSRDSLPQGVPLMGNGLQLRVLSGFKVRSQIPWAEVSGTIPGQQFLFFLALSPELVGPFL